MYRTTEREMPRYASHKTVHAHKIKFISPIKNTGDADLRGAAVITPEGDYVPFLVDKDYMDRHAPVAGGYYVVYKDGYRSFSPAEAFESGYTLMSL